MSIGSPRWYFIVLILLGLPANVAASEDIVQIAVARDSGDILFIDASQPGEPDGKFAAFAAALVVNHDSDHINGLLDDLVPLLKGGEYYQKAIGTENDLYWLAAQVELETVLRTHLGDYLGNIELTETAVAELSGDNLNLLVEPQYSTLVELTRIVPFEGRGEPPTTSYAVTRETVTCQVCSAGGGGFCPQGMCVVGCQGVVDQRL